MDAKVTFYTNLARSFSLLSSLSSSELPYYSHIVKKTCQIDLSYYSMLLSIQINNSKDEIEGIKNK